MVILGTTLGCMSSTPLQPHVNLNIYRLSQHHYSGGCCTARIQDLMNKALIRSNLTEFGGDIAAVAETGIPYIFG